jgi:transcription antitermination factor NusG
MSDQWLVLELSSRAEGEDPDDVCRAIRGVVKGSDVFIPAAVTQVGDDRVIHYLVEGYAFIRRTKPDSAYRALENCRYVQSLLVDHGKHALATVPNSEIEKMRTRMYAEADQGIGVDDIVTITAGPYKELTARVIEDYPESQTVQVHIQLRSKEAIITLPRSFLLVVTRKELSPVELQLRSFQEWLRFAGVLSNGWSGGCSPSA